MLLAARWADQNAPAFVRTRRVSCPGMPRCDERRARTVPEIDEFAGAELAGLLGLTTRGGEQLVRDALLIRHRHPRLWERIRNGRRPHLAGREGRPPVPGSGPGP